MFAGLYCIGIIDVKTFNVLPIPFLINSFPLVGLDLYIIPSDLEVGGFIKEYFIIYLGI